MNYELIMNYASILMAVMAALVFATNIIVEVFKYMFPKLPTSMDSSSSYVLDAAGELVVPSTVTMA